MPALCQLEPSNNKLMRTKERVSNFWLVFNLKLDISLKKIIVSDIKREWCFVGFEKYYLGGAENVIRF